MHAIQALFAAALALPALALADVYSCADASGRTVLRDAPCVQGERRIDRTAVRDAPRRAHGTQAEARLERRQVEQLLARLDRAMARGDVGSVLALYAPDAVLELSAGGGKATARMQRDGFARWLDERFASSPRAHRPTPARIALGAKQPRATIVRGLQEPVPGAAALRVVRERITVEQVSGQLLITRWRRDLPST
jgi:hypothetical protein